MRNKKTKRLVLIGVDAAETTLVRKWVAEGVLPMFAQLLAKGCALDVETPPAVLEGAIWPTIITGTSPATHGMFAYWQVVKGTYERRPGLRANYLRQPPLWKTLSDAGKRIAVVDVPFSRPLRGINGIQLTNWGAHDAWSWSRESRPRRLMEDILTRFGEHPVPHCDLEERSLADYENLRDRLIAGARRKAEVLKYSMKLDEWDFFFGVFSESHCAGHQLWHLLDRGHPKHNAHASPELQSSLKSVYAAIDEGLREVVQTLSEDAHVMLLLSHGMGPYYHGSHLLDQVLVRLGINQSLPSPSTGRSPAVEFGEMIWKSGSLMPRSIRTVVKTRVPAKLLRDVWSLTHPEPNPWTNMRVFSVPSHDMTGGLRINLKDREPRGLVNVGGEYDRLCDELIGELRALKNPQTGDTAVQWVAKSSELFAGERLDEMPDIFIEWNHDAPIIALCSPRIGTVEGVYRGGRSGSHSPGGLLAALGPEFTTFTCTPESKLKTVDIAPTVLDFFGIETPGHYEGASALPLLSITRDHLGAKQKVSTS